METFGTSWGDQAYERREGDSPTLVFLHGTGCDSADWHAVLRHLPSGLDTLSIDFRGHGESSVPDEDIEFRDLSLDIDLALEILHIERPIVVGHSLGGMVGIELSTRRTLMRSTPVTAATTPAPVDPTVPWRKTSRSPSRAGSGT